MKILRKRSSEAQSNVNNIAFIDTNDVCNLKCPTCVRGLRGMQNSSNQMPLEKFRKIVEKLSSEGHKQIGLYNWTEPFLNRNLHEYIPIIREFGMHSSLSTNMSFREMPGLEPVLRSGLDRMIVSVSGFDQEVYEINHINGDVGYVKQNLQIAASLKASGATSTQIELRFIKFSYNHDQEEKLRRFAEQLGIDFYVLRGAGDPMQANPSPRTNKDFEEMAAAFRSEKLSEHAGKVCPLIFGAGTAIDWNGIAYLCCAHPNYDALRIGSYLDLPQEEILLRKYYHPICASCGFPRRDATPADKQALVEALQFRLGIEQPAAPQALSSSPLPVWDDLSPVLLNGDLPDQG